MFPISKLARPIQGTVQYKLHILKATLGHNGLRRTSNTSVDGLELRPVKAVLTQAPSHDTSKTSLANDVSELLADKLRGVPSPENVVGAVPVVLATGLFVSDTVGLGSAPRGQSSSVRDFRVGLKGNGTGLASVLSLGVLKGDSSTSNGLSGAVGSWVGVEVLGVEGNTKVTLASVHANVDVVVDSLEGALNRGVVLRDVVATVHQVVAHDVNHVDRLENAGTLVGSVCNHVTLQTGGGDRKNLVSSDGIANSLQEDRESVDLARALRVRGGFVVFAISTGVLPVNV